MFQEMHISVDVPMGPAKYVPIGPRLRQQPGPGPGRLGWLAWFNMLLAWGGGVVRGEKRFHVFES